MKYHTHTLKNGLRIVLAPIPSSQTATVMVMTGTGSRYENVHENGLAHFLEHMFFKGTRKRRGARAISEELDSVGSVYNAYTAKERTAYFAKVASRYLGTALDVISDISLNSTLPAKEITKERGAIIQEIDMYEDMPMRTVDNVFEALMFGQEHTLGRTILGPKENIRNFTRADFVAYLKRNYTPKNTVVCIAGAFSEVRVLAKIKKEFGKAAHGIPPSYAIFTVEQKAPRVAIKEKKTDQTNFMLGVPAYPYLHADEFALAILNTILGEGMSSRLFTEVREKRGLAYSVRSAIELYPDTGYLAVFAGVEHAKLEMAVTTILAEFRKIKKQKVPSVELAKAKSYLKGTMAIRLESTDEMANHAATTMINLGRVRPLEEIFKAIDIVTADDVHRVACDILQTTKLNLAIIGPHPHQEKLLSLLRV